MDKLIRWFKTTAFYYWVILVIFPSIRYAFFAPEVGGKVIDILLSIIVSVVLVYLSGNIDLSGVGDVTKTGVIVLGVTVVLRFILSIFYLPSKLYFDLRKKQDRRIWEDIDIHEKEIKNKKISNYGIEITNSKAFDILRAHILVRYIEIDGILYSSQKDYRLAQTSHQNSSKLSWNGANPVEPTGIWIYKDGGSAFAYLFEVNRNSNEPGYKIRYFEFSENDGKLVPISRDVKNYVKCEFTCLVSYTLPDVVSGSGLYNLEIVIEGDKVKSKLNKGELPNKLPIEG